MPTCACVGMCICVCERQNWHFPLPRAPQEAPRGDRGGGPERKREEGWARTRDDRDSGWGSEERNGVESEERDKRARGEGVVLEGFPQALLGRRPKKKAARNSATASLPFESRGKSPSLLAAIEKVPRHWARGSHSPGTASRIRPP